jgi:hypothetical protein
MSLQGKRDLPAIADTHDPDDDDPQYDHDGEEYRQQDYNAARGYQKRKVS